MQKISTKFPSVAPNAGWVGKNCVFNRSRSLGLRRLTAEKLCPYAMVVCVQDCVLAEEFIRLPRKPRPWPTADSQSDYYKYRFQWRSVHNQP